VTGVTRNPVKAKEVPFAFGDVDDGAVAAGDVLVLKVLTRIGTNADGSRCGHPWAAIGSWNLTLE
jgi:hypothetical protein